MKKMILMAVMTAIAVSAWSLPYSVARSEALYLSDKMAYELNLSMAQYDAVYEINFDYLLSISNDGFDIYGQYWSRRNADLRYVLSPVQYDRYLRLEYFYCPVTWRDTGFVFSIYSRYADRTRFYFSRPSVFGTYRGGYNRVPDSHYVGRNYGVGGPKPDSWRRGSGGTTWHIGGPAGNNGPRPGANPGSQPRPGTENGSGRNIVPGGNPPAGNGGGAPNGSSGWHIGTGNPNQGNGGTTPNSGKGSSSQGGHNGNSTGNSTFGKGGNAGNGAPNQDAGQSANRQQPATNASQGQKTTNASGTFGGRRQTNK
ncbi:MAG: hypothetical protein IJ196_04040 [Prevotella sp.]|nr:hypothetical protein [Prevotella sp.]